MGGCLSHWNNDDDRRQIKKKRDIICKDMVNVITGKGTLKQYAVPVTASHVIHSETTSSSSSSNENYNNNNSSSSDDWFLCSSDSLYYDEYIQPLDLEEELEGGGQIYFMLPTSKLHYPLTGSDMAALAVKATLALQHTTPPPPPPLHHKHDKQQQQRNISSKNITNKARISPFLLADNDDEQQNQLTLKKAEDVLRTQKSLTNSHKSSTNNPEPGVSKSMRKLQRYSSTRAKMAVRSFRLRLTTIYEGSVLQFYS